MRPPGLSLAAAAGLDVTVHGARGVRRVECFGYLAHEIERSLRREQFLDSQQLAQVRAFDVGHCEVEDAVLLTGGRLLSQLHRDVDTGSRTRCCRC